MQSEVATFPFLVDMRSWKPLSLQQEKITWCNSCLLIFIRRDRQRCPVQLGCLFSELSLFHLVSFLSEASFTLSRGQDSNMSCNCLVIEEEELGLACLSCLCLGHNMKMKEARDKGKKSIDSFMLTNIK